MKSLSNPPAESAPAEPRLISVSRRSFLAKTAGLGAAAVVTACGNNDAQVFANVGSSTSTSTSAPDIADPADDATLRESTAGDVTGGTFPAGAELAIAFTYEFGSPDRQENPYMATWVEDPFGNLVALISLWIQQDMTDPRTERWFARLRRWSATGDDTISSATRVAGEHQVVWNGLDMAGAPVSQGDYVLFIESVRRGGTYSITSSPITIGETPFVTAIDANSEIVSASAEFII